MLYRAKRLSKPYNKYYNNIRTQKYKLKPFYRFTIVLLKTKEITVYHVFSIYNALFEHFEESITRLTPKTIP
ncbi:HAT dimerization [Penicillium robsamsonii]|uniref:HAT dimerization n=1 Tax=Penicillium robsamsonii TaxID=1792511 RepID=UPI002549A1FE|nr:HAT dimerization [Penicillium robsamsonii]KAJ5836148.1 HAT dimerization [Penicillium robsamsonii]